MVDSRGAAKSGGAADADPARGETTDDDRSGAVSTRKGEGTSRSSRSRSDESTARSGGKAKKKKGSSRNPISWLIKYIREIVSELRKVIRPSRSEFINYSIVVVVFLVVLTAFVALLDLGFQFSALRIFGTGGTG